MARSVFIVARGFCKGGRHVTHTHLNEPLSFSLLPDYHPPRILLMLVSRESVRARIGGEGTGEVPEEG